MERINGIDKYGLLDTVMFSFSSWKFMQRNRVYKEENRAVEADNVHSISASVTVAMNGMAAATTSCKNLSIMGN